MGWCEEYLAGQRDMVMRWGGVSGVQVTRWGRAGGDGPVHLLILGASCTGALPFQGDVVGWDAVAPPQLPGHTPVPNVLQPPAATGSATISSTQARLSSFTHQMGILS